MASLCQVLPSCNSRKRLLEQIQEAAISPDWQVHGSPTVCCLLDILCIFIIPWLQLWQRNINGLQRACKCHANSSFAIVFPAWPQPSALGAISFNKYKISSYITAADSWSPPSFVKLDSADHLMGRSCLFLNTADRTLLKKKKNLIF